MRISLNKWAVGAKSRRSSAKPKSQEFLDTGASEHMWVQCPQKPEEGSKPLETVATEGCKLSCGCWDPNPGPLKEQPLLLTTELCL